MSSQSRKYLAKRKAKRKQLNERIEQAMLNIQAHSSRDWDKVAQEGEQLLFSDDESNVDTDWNYYTSSDDEETDKSNHSSTDTDQEQPSPFERAVRGFGALMVPLMVSAGLGAYLAHLQSKKPPQAWFWGSSSPDDGSLKRNELKGRCKAIQYPGNAPC